MVNVKNSPKIQILMTCKKVINILVKNGIQFRINQTSLNNIEKNNVNINQYKKFKNNKKIL